MSSNSRYTPTIQKVLGLCIQGDVQGAYECLSHQPERTSQEETLLSQLHHRFFTHQPVYLVKSNDAWIQNVISAYYRYFRLVLTKQASLDEGELFLLTELQTFVSAENLEKVEESLQEEFTNRGYYFLGGKTLPYWGPYIWKNQDAHIFDVDIPSGTERLTVHFMDDFLLKSWLDFATMGLASTGGWAKEDGLYCVAQRYLSLTDVTFTISFLKHEAQHVADYRMFPGLAAKDLEYRAKVVELIYYPTKEKLTEFLQQADTNRDNAHTYAAFHIVSRVSEMLLPSASGFEPSSWSKVSVDQIQKAARELLVDHTQQLLSGSTGI